MVTRFASLARSTRDLSDTFSTIASKSARFISLGGAWADATSANLRPILTVPGGLPEFERKLIRARTGKGGGRAVASGVKVGHEPKLTLYQQRNVVKPRNAGQAVREIALSFGLHCGVIAKAAQ